MKVLVTRCASSQTGTRLRKSHVKLSGRLVPGAEDRIDEGLNGPQSLASYTWSNEWYQKNLTRYILGHQSSSKEVAKAHGICKLDTEYARKTAPCSVDELYE